MSGELIFIELTKFRKLRFTRPRPLVRKGAMADEHEQPEKVWDEYDWERFLRDQDLRTERYLDLLERYANHPERDELIALEMGWTDSNGEEEGFWDHFDLEDEEAADLTEMETADAEWADRAEVHPLYQASFELTVWLDEALERRGPAVAMHPAAVELSRQACILGGKLAAALSDPEGSELGMTIAYLKRALRAANLALNAYAEAHKEHLFGRTRDKRLREQLFFVRDGIVVLMGENRAEWRRRQGGR